MDSQVSILAMSYFMHVAELTPDSNYHNTFERHHRFIGWLGIAVCANP
jgi:hypothetical protein